MQLGVEYAQPHHLVRIDALLISFRARILLNLDPMTGGPVSWGWSQSQQSLHTQISLLAAAVGAAVFVGLHHCWLSGPHCEWGCSAMMLPGCSSRCYCSKWPGKPRSQGVLLLHMVDMAKFELIALMA